MEYNFNPRSHERSDNRIHCSPIHCMISIHAPTRGATSYNFNIRWCIQNFNPRSHERSDIDCVSLVHRLAHFNPRSHERSDKGEEYAVKMFEEISIHAPTRGATRERLCMNNCDKISIHAPTRGATVSSSTIYVPILFQSTLPREERQVLLFFLCYTFLHFNPRSHERSDSTVDLVIWDDIGISIHAPTRGATLLNNHIIITIKFQSTLPREERHLADAVGMIPAKIFQSTLPREERRVTILIYGGVYRISIHAPTRGAT